MQLTPGADELAVRTAVGRLLREWVGLGVDADQVAPEVPLAGPVGLDSPAPGSGVPRGWVGMRLASCGSDITATVTLNQAGDACSGPASGPGTPIGVSRVVAPATRRGVLADQTHLDAEVDGRQVAAAGGRRWAEAHVVVRTDAGVRARRGRAVIRGDPRPAIIHAVPGAGEPRTGLWALPVSMICWAPLAAQPPPGALAPVRLSRTPDAPRSARSAGRVPLGKVAGCLRSSACTGGES